MTAGDIFQILLILIGFSVLFLTLKKRADNSQSDTQSLILLQNQINEISKTLDAKLSESTQILHQQFGETARIIKDVTQELTRVGEGQRQVVDIARQLENLQNILKNPKQRGVVGEYFLKTVLENVLPPGSFALQYRLGRDETGRDLIVDAVIFVKERLIPIDSKFSLENYNRLIETIDEMERKRLENLLRVDLKNRIDETARYIRPADCTMEFAFMFIPSEAIYYDLLVHKIGSINARDLIEYAIVDKKVIIVSPTSFAAYLQTVLQGLRALQIEESAKEICKRVEELGRHLLNYEKFMKKLGSGLGSVVNTYNLAYKELGKVDKDVLRISGTQIGTEPITLDKPQEE